MRITNTLLAVIYLFGAATLGLWLRLIGLDTATSCLIAVVQLLFCMQVHASFLRRNDKRRTAREIAMLRQAGLAFSTALDETRASITEMKSVFEAKASAQNSKIVSELRVLESLVREFAAKIAEKSKAVPQGDKAETHVERPTKGPAGNYLDSLGQPELLEIIRAALEENRVDLYLQPVVTLPQRKLRFYEALSRLRAEDGTVIMPAQYMKIAAPVGLMSVVDNLLLFRCVQIVRRMTPKSRDVAVFCNISGDTLVDAEFFPQFLEFMHHNRDLAGQIVFEFSQDAVAKAGTKGQENLSYLSSLGFALSMDHVETLAVDFGKLHTLGFRYMKVRAPVLVNGLRVAGAPVMAEDLKTLLARYGLDLIAERVENEKTVVQLLDFGVDFGQGFLFGEPRAVRDEPRETEQQQAAAPVIPFRKAG